MLNKVDKFFIISEIIIFVMIIIIFLLFFLAALLKQGFVSQIILGINFGIVLFSVFIIPICYVIQLTTLFLQLFSKNKCKKDYILILINIISLLVWGYFILIMVYIWFTVDEIIFI